MTAKEPLKSFAKLQYDRICTMAQAIADGTCATERLEPEIEIYVQARISLALKFGELMI